MQWLRERQGELRGVSAEAAQKVNVQGANLFEVHGPRLTSELSCAGSPILPNLLASHAQRTAAPCSRERRVKLYVAYILVFLSYTK